MIIDETYFVRRLNLPQIGNADGLADVRSFINQYETEYLQCVLGLDLWQAFIDGTEGSGIPDQRWLDLLNGKNFTYKNCTHNWPGFASASKISPIANYVYYQYVDNKIAEFVLTGVVVSSTDNNRTVAAVDRLVDAWNRMIDMNKDLYRFLKLNQVTYPEWALCYEIDGCGCGCGCDKCAPVGCGRFFQKINSLNL